MKKRKRGKGSAKVPGFGVVVFPDGTEIRPEDWHRPGAVQPHEPKTDLDETDDLYCSEDILQKYGKYLDEEGVPLRGINPNPKYYVVPKETERPPKKAGVRKVEKSKKVTIRKKKPAKTVTVRKKSSGTNRN